MNKKVCIITGTRAEYGLFLPLLRRLEADTLFEVQIMATGMHLSPEFGLTYREIEEDGFTINEKIEILLSSDTGTGISKSIGLGVIGISEALARLNPDALIALGDRFETFAAVVAAYVARVPVVHLYGGETTEGAFDEGFRHSITKMSCLHFTSTESYRSRVIQLGEPPETVFNVGALGIDNVKSVGLLSKEELEKSLACSFGPRCALVTFHPVTLEDNSAAEQFKNLLEALETHDDLNIIFTKPNADTGGRIIIAMIDEFVKKRPERFFAYTSLGQRNYLSAVSHVDVVVGNSSSGIVEVPSLGKPTVNIGDRQKGRIRAASVIDCKPERDAINDALVRALSAAHLALCGKVVNPYGDGNSAGKIHDILKSRMGDLDIKKGFHDIKF